MIHFRKGWRRHVWQGRFTSYPMNEAYLLAAVRYVELNPVRAGPVESLGVYTWSSAAAHLTGRDDELVKAGPLLELAPNWVTVLSTEFSDTDSEALRRHERTGRPLGDDDFIAKLESALGRSMRRQEPGPKGLTDRRQNKYTKFSQGKLRCRSVVRKAQLP